MALKATADGYPRLCFKKNELDLFLTKIHDESTNYAGYSYASVTSSVLRSADAILAEKSFSCKYYGDYVVEYKYPLVQPGFMENPPLFKANARYPYWTMMGGAIRNRIKCLAAAFVLSGEEKYAKRATELCLDVSAWSSWSDPSYGNGEACLDSGYITAGVCTAYDLLHDHFSPEDREKIRKGILENGIKRPMRQLNMSVDHNIQVVLTTGVALACCCILGESDDDGGITDEALERCYEYFKWYLDKRYDSGKHEGNMYTTLALENIMSAAYAIYNCTGDRTLFDHRYISEVLFKWMIAGGENKCGLFAPISDGSVSVGFFLTASALNKTTGNTLAGYYLKRSKVFSASLEGLIFGLEQPRYALPPKSLQSVYLDKIGWGCMRTGWEKSDTTFVFTCSRSDLGHNHFDNNSFVVSRSGNWIANDPGYEDYSPGDNADFTLFYGHSAIYVDGVAQNLRGNSTISDVLTGDVFSYMIGHGEKSYRNFTPEKADRAFVMVNVGDDPYFVIKDDLDFPDEHVYTWRLNVQGLAGAFADGKELALSEKTRSKGFSYVWGDDAVCADFACGEGYPVEYHQYKTVASSRLIDVSTEEKSKKADFLTVFSTFGKDETDRMTKVSENVDTSSLRGCKVESGRKKREDLILFSKESGVVYKDLDTDGSSLFAFGGEDISAGFAATDASYLQKSGKTVFSCDKKASLVLSRVPGRGSDCVIDSAEGCAVFLDGSLFDTPPRGVISDGAEASLEASGAGVVLKKAPGKAFISFIY